MSADIEKITAKIVKNTGEVRRYYRVTKRRFSYFCSHGSVVKIDVRVDYRTGGWNEGSYTDKKEAMHAFRAFIE